MLDYFWLGEKNLEHVKVLIPYYYQNAIISGELKGIMACESTYENDHVVGVILFRKRKRWMEIVWIAVTDEFRDTDSAEE